MRGKFITFEGVEGCGKTTQIKLLDEYLRRKGLDVVLTREPGGTAIGDKIRAVLLDPANKGMHPVTELLLYEAARSQHVEELVRPALAEGKIVLSDRYADATTAYQGAARNLKPELLNQLNEITTGGLKPDLTILLDLPAKEGLARANKRGSPDRFEQEGLKFHEDVRRGYLDIAKREPGRVVVVDGMKKIEEIHKEVIRAVEKVCN